MMLLSEAIRLGALIRPKIDGYFFRDGRSCAFGAALEATGTPYTENEDYRAIVCLGEQIRQRWPYVETVPMSGYGVDIDGNSVALAGPLRMMIPWLNNWTGGVEYTREQIADLVEAAERAAGYHATETSAPTPAPVATSDSQCLSAATRK